MDEAEAKARQQIKDLDLDIVAWKMYQPVDKGGSGWSVEKIKRSIELYRAFLFVCWKYRDKENVPNYDIDMVWHNHILFTKKYIKDCNDIFGKYHNHNPDAGMPSITQDFLQNLHD